MSEVSYQKTNVIRKEKPTKRCIENVIHQVHDALLKSDEDKKHGEFLYNVEMAPTLSTNIGDQVKNKLCDLNFRRYKYLVQVVIGEKKEQGVNMSSRQLFDNNCDRFGSVTFQNDFLFCTTTAYAVYHQ